MIDSRIHLLILLGLFTFLLTNCGNHNLSNKTPAPPQFNHGRELIAHLDYNLSLLKNLDANDEEFNENAVLINEQIRKTIEQIQSKKLLKEVCKSYNILEHDFVFTLSKDEKVGVFSWESRMQRTLHSIRNIALYINDGKVIPTSLYGESIAYQQIHTIKTSAKSFYLLQGQGGTNTTNGFFRMDAYTINEHGMELAKIFPNRQSSMVSPLDFNVEMDGSLILIPETWGTTLAYRPLELHADHQNVNYAEATTTIDQQLSSEAFEAESSNSFLQGSEMPKKIERPTDETLLFLDGYAVKTLHNEGNNQSLFKLTTPSALETEIPWEGKVSLVAKKNHFLFFSEEMGSSVGRLHLYDIDQKNVQWSRPMTKALILDDSILFTEEIEAYLLSNPNEVSCSSSVGVNRAYYKVYSVTYGEKHPIVEFTNQIFCGSSSNNQLAKL
ncbi:hypothetical protein [Flagellimonas sp.]|uniref:hypothetical protein n=1 Tax=Flagellimonas sp. TaxID=2058762 RepID=UPI003B527BDD